MLQFVSCGEETVTALMHAAIVLINLRHSIDPQRTDISVVADRVRYHTRYAPAQLTKRKWNTLCMRFNRTCCNVFSDTFSRDEIAFFIFMNILSLYLCQGEFYCFNFYRYSVPSHTTSSQKKIISVPSIVYIIHIICVYIVSSHRV